MWRTRFTNAAIAVVLLWGLTPSVSAAERTCPASGSHPNFFEANLDVYGGNSGSPTTAPGRQGGHMTVLEDYEAVTVHGVVVVAPGIVLHPRTADASCADLDDDGRIGLTALEIRLEGRTSDDVIATVTPSAGEIDQSGRYDITTRFNPDSGLDVATGTMRITMWFDGSRPPGPRR